MTTDQDRIDAMERLCDGMTTEDLNQAPFTYLALLQIVQRREGCVPLSALVLPSKSPDTDTHSAQGYNLAIDQVQRRINKLMEQAK